ncbi:MAG: hypothetical protein IT319_21990, partial [Anaerolineae bacterium]|nr:hypothetical protein [Anaerolineae bacterium]
MRRLLLPVLVLLGAIGVLAQPDLPQPGEPPVLEHITVSPPSATGTVTISGAAGAVFPNAYVAVRSLYTGSTAFAHAGITGSFSVEIDGVENTPYWISPSEEQITADMQREAESITGSLPGGPGVIVYSPFAEAQPASQPITQIAIDGDLSDWDAYPDAVRVENEGRSIAALRNADSLFVTLSGDYTRRPYTLLEIRFTVDTNSYTVTLDPRQSAPAVLARVNPSARDLGTLNIASRQVMG